jgi:hypothetical protein
MSSTAEAGLVLRLEAVGLFMKHDISFTSWPAVMVSAAVNEAREGEERF